MIQFSYSNDANVSSEERERYKKAFLDKLGPFKDEFDEKNGFVNINFGVPDTDDKKFTFNVGGPDDLSDFIMRFNEYVKGSQ